MLVGVIVPVVDVHFAMSAAVAVVGLVVVVAVVAR